MRAVDERCVSDLYAMCMSDRLRELTAFVRAGETGSFSRVARELGVSQPSISRMVADLEARLGVKLLLRTTRHVTPTDAGRVFLERARHILGDLDDAENAARGVDGLRGTLRVALSEAFGTREVIPRLPSFAAQHPKLGIELLMSDRTDDLIAEGADMALRLGPLPDSGFGARLLARRRASPWPRRVTLRARERRKRRPISLGMTAFSARVSPGGPAGVSRDQGKQRP